MTPAVQQLLDDLAADTSVSWAIFGGLDIRASHRPSGSPEEWHCPLSWLAKTSPCDIEAAAAHFGLSEEDVAPIANAADNPDHPLRAELLRACRLTEDGR